MSVRYGLGARGLVLFLAVVFVLVIFQSTPAYADDRYYEISRYTVNVIINPDGSAGIEERITYNFNGEFNGIFRDVDFSRTGGMENVKVYVEKDGNLVEWRLNSTSDLDVSGGVGTYNLVTENNIAHFKIFEKSNDEIKSFIIKYFFRDAVTKYNDIAEFNRKIVDSNWDVALKNVSINFFLPEGASRDEIKVFGHGSLTGESKIIDEKNVQFNVPKVYPGNTVETLVLFPTRLVPEAQKIVNKDALPEIMANEQKLAEEANRIREEAQKELARKAKLRSYGDKITLVLAVLWLFIIFYIYRKYDRELKSSFDAKYYRELPGEYTPAEMGVLLSMGRVATRDVTATLMDLVRKKQLTITANKYMKKSMFKDKEITEYIVAVNENKPDILLKQHEEFLIEWFIGTIGDGTSLKLDDISDYARSTANARQFQKDYQKWSGLVEKEAEKNGFFDETCKKGRTIGVMISFGYLAGGILLLAMLGSLSSFVLILQSMILLIFSARISRRTEYGNEQKAMWKAFENFLRDFSQMEKAVIPSIVIWENYLVYAISLGVAKEVIKQLPIVFGDDELQNTGLTYMHGYGNYATFAMLSNSLEKTVHFVDSAIGNGMAVANSTLSSSSGSGGGFSGGSSGGGGGGGGGGAF